MSAAVPRPHVEKCWDCDQTHALMVRVGAKVYCRMHAWMRGHVSEEGNVLCTTPTRYVTRVMRRRCLNRMPNGKACNRIFRVKYHQGVKHGLNRTPARVKRRLCRICTLAKKNKRKGKTC